jgi:hypothetical protein
MNFGKQNGELYHDRHACAGALRKYRSDQADRRAGRTAKARWDSH